MATSVATVPSVKRAVHNATRPAPAKHKLAQARKKPVQTAAIGKGIPCDSTPAIRTSSILPYAITLPPVETADAGTGNIPGAPFLGGGGVPRGGVPGGFIGGGGIPGGGNPGGGIPGDPGVTTPTDPVTPTDPTTPVDPGTPTTPVDPGTPTTPVDPGTPTTPVDPGTPTTPVDPGTPTTPVDPGTPTTPLDPGTPTTPVDPTDPGIPIDPTGPVPEPGTWMLMISGFGLVGMGLRWRRKRQFLLTDERAIAQAAGATSTRSSTVRRRRSRAKKASGFSTVMAALGFGEAATGSASLATIAAKTMMCVCPTAAIVGTTMAVPPVKSAVFKATAVPVTAPKYLTTVVKPPCDPSIRSVDASDTPARVIDATDASPKMQTALLASTAGAPTTGGQ